MNVVYTDIHYVNKNGKIIRNWKANLFTNIIETKSYYNNKISYGWMMPHPGLYVKRKFIKKIGFLTIILKYPLTTILLLDYLKIKIYVHIIYRSLA